MPEPLRKTKPDGTPYFRPERVEAKLVLLEQLARNELAARCDILDEAHPDHVSTECILHFVRATCDDNSKASQECLYKHLLRRVLRRLPKERREGAETVAAEGIRRFVLDRFEELLASDQDEYCESLDFYEIAFDGALSKLRSDARRKAWRDRKRFVRAPEGDPDWSSITVEASAVPCPTEVIDDPTYLSRVDAAIASLPRDLREVVEMLRLDYPIESRDADEPSIVKRLGVVEKTVRNRRDRAIAAIRAKLADDGQ